MSEYIWPIFELLCFLFPVICMAQAAKHEDICQTILWGVSALIVWLGLLAEWLKE